MLNAITIDVEEWFCVEAFRQQFPMQAWARQKTRIQTNIVHVVELLKEYDVKATFFILGWIADKFPQIVEYLHSNGHEIGCHSYSHKLVYQMTPQEFKEDTLKSIAAIRGESNIPLIGYRAPTFSVKPEHDWVWESLAECGFKYDSSIFPIVHDLYGSKDAPRFAHEIQVSGGKSILEIPLSTIRILGKNVGFGGGGYLRIFPYWFTNWAIKKLNAQGFPVVVYFHPWEIDRNHPRLKAPIKSRLRHFTNLRTMEIKLKKLLEKFKFGPIKQVFKLEYT